MKKLADKGTEIIVSLEYGILSNILQKAIITIYGCQNY